jgi:hypothetical protein
MAVIFLLLTCLAICACAVKPGGGGTGNLPVISPAGEENGRVAHATAGATSFQIHSPWSPRRDYQADIAIIYGVDDSFARRLQSFAAHGYQTEIMTGAAWGNYQDYIDGRFDGQNHLDDAQVRRDGTRVMHDPTVPYMVPSVAYRTYLKAKLAKAIDAGASAVYLEEPEFWAFAGYSEGFKREYKAHYGIDWAPPHSSPTARWRADQLKYILYRDTLDELFSFCKQHARSIGREVRCYVPTHSLISYAQIQMVSPMSSLMGLKDADGYIAQVWTGTARHPNTYRGVIKERTFEMAYLEYAQMAAMVRPTRRTCYFLADPIEDDPNHGWDDYEANYKRTLVASLMQPDVCHYEVAPWPDRVFERNYFATEASARRRDKPNSPARVPISDAYATVLLTCFNALADMDGRASAGGPPQIRWDSGPQRIGVLVSDSMMFQREQPSPGDPHLNSFFGLAMPLLKRGVPVKIVQLETLSPSPGTPGEGRGEGFRSTLRDIDVLLMTYEGMKPMNPDVHAPLAEWVRSGGSLILIDDFYDPYHQVHAWWQEAGFPHAAAHLLKSLDLPANPSPGVHAAGRGRLIYAPLSPAALASKADGDRTVSDLVANALRLAGKSAQWRPQSHLILHRGPYVVAAVMDESIVDQPVTVKGRFVDLFDPDLSIVIDPALKPGTVAMYRDLDATPGPAILASSSRIRNVQISADSLLYESRGPAGTNCVTRLILPREPRQIRAVSGGQEAPLHMSWDKSTRTALIRHANVAASVQIRCSW